MKDLFLKTPDKQTLVQSLNIEGLLTDSDYYQNEQFIIDYIGRIPKEIDAETGDVIEWSLNDRFNVRLVDEDVTLFDSFESVHPETPYRVFS